MKVDVLIVSKPNIIDVGARFLVEITWNNGEKISRYIDDADWVKSMLERAYREGFEAAAKMELG